MSRILRRAGLAAVLGAIAACAMTPAPTPAPVEVRGESAAPSAREGAPSAAPTAPTAPTAAPAPAPPRAETPEARARSRWVATTYADLPGWADDRSAEVWPALIAGCTRPAAGWNETCARALLDPPSGHDAVRRWIESHLQPHRIESADGGSEGLLTGYFEPTLDAARKPRGSFRVPLFAPPAALAMRRPFYTRQQLDSLPAAMATLRGHEIAWIEDPLDALLVQVQGSGRLRLLEDNGRPAATVRLAYAAHNDQPFRSLGRWLIDQGELQPDAASWPAIKAWAQKNPKRLQELLWANPRYVFFREEPLPDLGIGPRGAFGVPLTPGRSIAVDPQSVPLGAAVWIDTTEPLSSQPLQRLVMAQDSGSAITGAVRADFFWGWHRQAEALAGRTKQALRLWVLWPRGTALPVTPVASP